MRLTITTDYAIRIVCFLAEHQQMTSTAELANELGVPVNYIPKITKQLKKANLISSLEGIKGGYVLAKSPENISLMDVMSCTESTMAINRCLEKDGYCSGYRINHCRVHQILLDMQNSYNSKLEQIKISDIVEKDKKEDCGDYYSVFKLELNTGKLECLYSYNREIEIALSEKTDFKVFIKKYVEDYVVLEDREKVGEFLKLEAMKILPNSEVYEENIQYRRKNNDKQVWMEIKKYKNPEKDIVILSEHRSKLVSRAMVNMEQELRKKEGAVTRQYWDMVHLLVTVLNHNNLSEPENQENICFYTEQVYRKLSELYPSLGISEYEIQNVAKLAPIHDIGKIRVPIEILNKKGKLTPEEMEKVKIHPIAGAEMTLRFPKGVTTEQLNQYSYDICHCHHERYDGNGYPDGLKGDEIPLCAQVIGLVDAYDALISKRPYKGKYEHEEAIRMIINGECGAFSKSLIRCFLAAAMQPEWIKKAES